MTNIPSPHRIPAALLAALLVVLVAVPAAQAQTARNRPAARTAAPDAHRPAASDKDLPATPAPLRTQSEPVFEPATAAELQSGYPLGVGDVVRVVIFQQPDMTTETRVSEAGTITIPLLGAVPVGNVTPRRAEERIGAVLKARGLVRDPQVVVTVLQFRSRPVAVLGLVQRPGRYYLEEGSYRVSDVLALAGGPMPDSADIVTLIRMRDGKGARYELDIPALFRSGDFSRNPEVMPGDSIFVDRAPIFYIYGEVMKPGAYRLDKDISVMQALALSGGLTGRGTEKNLQIRHRDAQGRYVFVKSSLADIVQPNDVLFVRESLF